MQSALDGMRYSNTRHALPAIEDDEGHDGDETYDDHRNKDLKEETIQPITSETRTNNNNNNNNNRKVSPRPSPRPIPANKVVPIAGGDEEEGGAHNLDLDVEAAAGIREKTAHHKVEKDLLQLKPAAAAAVSSSSSKANTCILLILILIYHYHHYHHIMPY